MQEKTYMRILHRKSDNIRLNRTTWQVCYCPFGSKLNTRKFHNCTSSTKQQSLNTFLITNNFPNIPKLWEYSRIPMCNIFFYSNAYCLVLPLWIRYQVPNIRRFQIRDYSVGKLFVIGTVIWKFRSHPVWHPLMSVHHASLHTLALKPLIHRHSPMSY